jgi:hypothetical protein
VSRNVHIRTVRVSSESDGSGAALDHDVAAGATISTACSPCQAGTYFSGSGWTPLLKRRGASTTWHRLMSAGGCSESLIGRRWRKSCAKCDGAWCGHTWTRACLHAVRRLGVSMARERVRRQMQARQLAHDRAYRVRTRLGCAGVSCVSWLVVDHHGHLIGSC